MEPPKTPTIDDFERGNLIHKGNLAKVFKATHKQTGQACALKTSSKEALSKVKFRDPDTCDQVDGVEGMRREMKAFAALDSSESGGRCFPTLMLATQDDTSLYIVMEVSEIGPPLLFDDDKAAYTPNPAYEQHRLPELGQTYLQMAEALAAVHEARFAHLDIKVENYLVFDEQGGGRRLKLIDFERAKPFDSDQPLTQTQYGSLFYLPPEYYQSLDGYNPFLADVYALGVCFFILATLRLPYTASNDPDTEPFQDVVYETNICEQVVDLDPLPAEYQTLVGAMLTKEPEERLTARQAVMELTKILAKSKEG